MSTALPYTGGMMYTAKNVPAGWTAEQWEHYRSRYSSGGARGEIRQEPEHIDVPEEYLANRGLYAESGW